MHIVLIANAPSVARTRVYDALAEQSASAGKRFHVLYCAKHESDRSGSYDSVNMRHAHTVLRGFHPSLTGIHAHINPGVLAELNLLKPDTLLMAGPWNIPTFLLAGLNIYTPAPRRFYWPDQASCVLKPCRGLMGWGKRRILSNFDGYVLNVASTDSSVSGITLCNKQAIVLPALGEAKHLAKLLINGLYP